MVKEFMGAGLRLSILVVPLISSGIAQPVEETPAGYKFQQHILMECIVSNRKYARVGGSGKTAMN